MSKKLFIFLAAIIAFVLLKEGVFFKKTVDEKAEVVPQVIETTGETQKVKIFLIALNDNGVRGKKVGCEDSVVPIEREITPTKAVLKTSLEELLLLKDKNYEESGLYNALSGSNLRLDTASLDGSGKAKIELSGGYKFTGVCEDSRFIAQIEETSRQFTTVKEVEIFLNGRNLKSLYK